MKNKNLQHIELDLIELLLETVNSKEEYEYLEVEKSQLLSSHVYIAERRCSK